jgi:hypothetical protein
LQLQIVNVNGNDFEPEHCQAGHNHQRRGDTPAR